jgi:LDH2 family malate/lactate/ureidoglycolate dehydrogenase
MLISVNEAREVALRALIAHHVTPDHAALQADLLLDAQMRGVASHGLLRLPRVIERIARGVSAPNAVGTHTWSASHLLQVDGQQGLGPVVAWSALDAIIPKARTAGIAAAAITNGNHLGMLAWYARTVAQHGLILIAMTISEALVHPWGGRHAMLGTNPLAIGVPASPRPLVLDMATSLVSMGRIHDHANRGLPIPPGWALDEHGNATTDAQAATRGAIAPFGGAKGYALGLALEVLVATLSGCALGTSVQGTLDSSAACNKGDVFIVCAPQRATAVGTAVDTYLDAIRASAPTQAGASVTVPGDRAESAYEAALTNGVEIDAALWNQLVALAGTHSGARLQEMTQ